MNSIPENLFEKNSKLVDLSLQGNNFSKIEAYQLPLNQLKRLVIGENPFECNCSLLWLWQLTTSQTSSYYGLDKISTSLQLDKENIYCFDLTSNGVKQRKNLTEVLDLRIHCNSFFKPIMCMLIIFCIVVLTLLITLKCRKFLARDKKFHRSNELYINKQHVYEQYFLQNSLLHQISVQPPENATYSAKNDEHQENSLRFLSNKRNRQSKIIFV